MCGICGYIDPAGVSPENLRRMTDTLRHRGPDDEGIFLDTNIGFGHRRLSIIDLDGGRQPMANEDGSIWITYNGEIYNHEEIRKGLEGKHRFSTRSDTEVILHLYEEKGERCLEDFRGMYAFAIYDFLKRKLLIARDHLGQKPLYYYHQEEVFAFASEIKALLAFREGLAEMDDAALYEYLTLRIIAPPRSMFRKIRKLPPAHYLVFQNGRVTISRYWELQYDRKLKGDFHSIKEELEKRIEETVQYHLVSDVPVGAFLSGGMDSSLIVAMMSKVAETPISTFSGDVPYQNYSEIPYATLVSDKYRTENHKLTIDPSLIRTLPDLVWHLDEPSDSLSTCMYHLSRLVREKVKVVLGGDGGDELFGGYDRYFGNRMASYYAILPAFLREHVIGKMINRVPEGNWYRSFGHKIKWFQQMSFCQGADRYAKSLSYFYFNDASGWNIYTDRFKKRVSLFDSEGCIKEYFNCSNATDLVDKMLYADAMVRMPDHPVMILDRMTMAHGLEARSPFMDHKLFEFSASIPSKYKIRHGKLRYIQVELSKKYLPQEVINRKKQGFNSPLSYMLAEEFRLLYRTFLRNSSLVRDGYLEGSAISRLLQDHLNNRFDHGHRLWLLFNSEIWYRMHIDGMKREEIRQTLDALS